MNFTMITLPLLLPEPGGDLFGDLHWEYLVWFLQVKPTKTLQLLEFLIVGAYAAFNNLPELSLKCPTSLCLQRSCLSALGKQL